MNLRPVMLSGNRVRLEPLGLQHVADLTAAAGFDEIWAYLDESTPANEDDVSGLINDALADQAAGRRLAFAIVDRELDRAVGSTSFIDIRPQDRGVEVGWIWLTPGSWGKGINLESGYLLLRHAFEQQDAIRVAFKADVRNERSRRAITALGGVQEGIWRNHRILSTGAYRDSVFFSVIEADWPAVKTSLVARLGQMPDSP